MNTRAHDYNCTAAALPTDAVLTRTETIIASGYVCGLSGKEIADINSVEYNTVIRHTQNIYEKTGIARSTHALVAWFLSMNLNLDLTDFRRRAGALMLLGLVCFQIVENDGTFIRSARQTSVRARSGRSRQDDGDTYEI